MQLKDAMHYIYTQKLGQSEKVFNEDFELLNTEIKEKAVHHSVITGVVFWLNNDLQEADFNIVYIDSEPYAYLLNTEDDEPVYFYDAQKYQLLMYQTRGDSVKITKMHHKQLSLFDYMPFTIPNEAA